MSYTLLKRESTKWSGRPRWGDLQPWYSITWGNIISTFPSQCYKYKGGYYEAYGCSGACANQCVSTYAKLIQNNLVIKNNLVNSFSSCISGNCVTCPAGQFFQNSACYWCTSGYYCNNNERYVVSSGYYSSPDKSGQIRCEAGFYCSNGVKGQCSAGSYQPHSGMSYCYSCQFGGQYCPNQQMSDYLPCPIGFECSGSTKTACSAGEYTPQAGSSCTTCPSGSYAINNGAACATCPLYHFCVNGLKSQCPPGSEALVQGLSECVACPDSTYKSGYDGVCEIVPDGYTTDDGIDLQQCQAGHFCIQGLEESCAEGHFQEETGQSVCPPCGVHTYQPEKGKESCIDSVAGYQVLTTGAAKSDPCNFGFFNPEKLSSCKSCDPGFFCDEEGLITQKSCEPGTYQDEQESTFCKDCPLGHFCPTQNLTAAIVCPSGWIAGSTKMTSCTKCDLGFEEDKNLPIESTDIRCKMIKYGHWYYYIFLITAGKVTK